MRKLGVIALVCVGLLTLVQGLQYLFSSVATTVFTVGNGDVAASIFIGALALLGSTGTLIFGALLIAKRETLAQRWFEDGEVGLLPSAVDLLRLALIVMGVSIVISALTRMLLSIGDPLALAGYEQVLLGGGGESGSFVLVKIAPSVLLGLAQLGLGAVLVTRSESISTRLWLGKQAAPAIEPPQPQKCPACGAAFDPADYQGDPAEWHCVECHSRLSTDA